MAASILIKISQISVRVLNLKGIFVIVFETDPLFVGRHLGFSSKFIEIKLNRVNRSAIHFWKQICLAFFVGNKPLPVYPQFFFFFFKFQNTKTSYLSESLWPLQHKAGVVIFCHSLKWQNIYSHRPGESKWAQGVCVCVCGHFWTLTMTEREGRFSLNLEHKLKC